MIRLDPPVIEAACPACAAPLAASGWYVPGMRMLARARCTGCGRDWFVDLPAGQGRLSPMLLDPATGLVHDAVGVPWFATWLRDSWRDRTATSPAFTVQRRGEARRPAVLVNCIDTLYGHALLKLLGAQPYLDSDRHDVLLLIQPCLAALIPDGVAEVWLVDLPLKRGTLWSVGLAAAIAEEAKRFPDLHLAPLPPHPHPASFSIERFSRIAPFRCDRWEERPSTVTFIWREDRRWRTGLRSQVKAVANFFETLRRLLPDLDAAVAGFGAAGGLPGWIADLRAQTPDPSTERAWLARYASSHAVVGVHGSNMLLPSAHAGSTFELLPEERHGNFLQDIIFNGADARDLFFRTRFLPDDIAPARLAARVAMVVDRYPDFVRLMESGTGTDADVRH